MQKKTFLQLILSLFIIVIFVTFYNKYFVEKKIVNSVSENIILKKSNLDKTKSNLIHNITYTSVKKGGDYYVIKSELGELNTNQPELILMKKVQAEINFKNSSSVIISSDNAIYNNISYKTNFYDNVLIAYTDHTIEANNFDLNFEKNLGIISNNIIYKTLNTQLEADKIEIDLITKNSKIFMNKKTKQIKITDIN